MGAARSGKVGEVEEAASTHLSVGPPCDKHSTCGGELCLCTSLGMCTGYYNGQVSTADPSVNASKKLFAGALENAYQDQLSLGFNLLALTTLPATNVELLARAWEVRLPVSVPLVSLAYGMCFGHED